jgi:hypothetical protein
VIAIDAVDPVALDKALQDATWKDVMRLRGGGNLARLTHDEA